MFRFLVLFLFVIISGCGTSDNPTDTTDIPGYVRMSVITEPDTVASGLDDVFSTVTVTLSDESHNPLPAGLSVHFSATHGTIQSTSTTDESGQAIVRYTPSPEPGVVQINATYEGVHGPVQGGGRVCIVDSRNPIYLVVSADPPEVSVAGRGMNSTSIISAIVMNGIGEPVTEEVEVRFQLFGEPDRRPATLNGNGGDETVETINGVAQVGYNASEAPNQPLIRITTADLDNNEVIWFDNPVTVVSGRPFSGAVEMCNEGIDAGGGTWKIEVSARISDLYRNPARDGVSVVFTVEPEIATVGTAYTGNKNRNGVSIPGVAFTELVYHSANTFNEIEISAEVQWERMMMPRSLEALLPLQEGKLDFSIDPGNWQFDEDNRLADAVIRCWAILRDGHGTLINNAQILFSSSRSRFWSYDFREGRFDVFFPNPSIKYTGIDDDENNEPPGQATVYLIGGEGDFYLDPFSLQTDVKVEARVLGFESETATSRTLYITRPCR